MHVLTLVVRKKWGIYKIDIIPYFSNPWSRSIGGNRRGPNSISCTNIIYFDMWSSRNFLKSWLENINLFRLAIMSVVTCTPLEMVWFTSGYLEFSLMMIGREYSFQSGMFPSSVVTKPNPKPSTSLVALNLCSGNTTWTVVHFFLGGFTWRNCSKSSNTS